MNVSPSPPLRIGSPGSLLAVIPGLLGFHPEHSLVVTGAKPPRARIQVAFRYDLPDPSSEYATAKIADHATAILAKQRLTTAIVAGYGPGPLVTPAADALVAGLRRAGITLHDVLRVEDGRYWSYACHDSRCCPPEGVPFDPATHPAAAAMAASGYEVLRDRATLAATIAPLGGVAGETMRQAIGQVERRIAGTLAQGRRVGLSRERARHVADEGLQAVQGALGAYRQGGTIPDGRLAWLAVSLTDLRVRDDAWARMVPEHTDAHQRLWTDLVRRVPARYIPAPASLLAFTAWQSGNGALANVAIERALAADPEYSMARLLSEALSAGIPPSAARLPMTPEEVAASYARADATNRD